MKNIIQIVLCAVSIFLFSCEFNINPSATSIDKKSKYIDENADIKPKYFDLIIPPNIAPLNFKINEEGISYCAKLYSKNGKSIFIISSDGKISIPEKKWRNLLDINKGNKLKVDVYVKTKEKIWRKFKTITNKISKDLIDSYVVYRILKVNYNWYENMGIYQRNLENFKESIILHTRNFKKGCFNCHTFLNNDPQKLFLHIRSKEKGSSAIISMNNKAQKIGTKFGYTCWHPSGKFVTYSINKVSQLFHSTGLEPRDIFDKASCLLNYDIKKEVVSTVPQISDSNSMETYPNWSPDGKYLYFCNAPKWVPPSGQADVKYSLLRVSYDQEKDLWGKVETVLSASETRLSITLPRVSPDGMFLLFCMNDFGPSPHMRTNGDLYLMDLQTMEYKKLDNRVNSIYSESWHSWSINSRWIAFSSKKIGGLFTRLYISHVDKDGNVSKSFSLPQKDPEFYDTFLKTYSVPEFTTGFVSVKNSELMRAISSKEAIDVTLPVSGATIKKLGANEPWASVRE